jgi:ABC-type multidrug transport system fused ATPase/permease subunit
MPQKQNYGQTALRLSRYLLSLKTEIALLCACFVASTGLAFAQPLIIRAITDQGMGGKDFGAVVFFSAALLASAFAWQGLDVLQTNLFVKVHNEFSLRLYVQAFEKLFKMPISYFQNRNPAEIVGRVTMDVDAAASVTDQSVMYSASSIFSVASGLAGLVVVNWRLSLLVIFMVPVKFLIVIKLSAAKSVKTKKRIEIARAFSNWLGDMIAGVKEIKLWNLLPLKTLEFTRRRKQIMENYRENAMLDKYNLFLEVMLDTLTACAAYAFAGWLICAGRFTIGGAFAFIAYSSGVMGPLSAVLNIKYDLTRIMPSAARLFEFFDMGEEEGREGEARGDKASPASGEGGAGRGFVDFDRVGFAYDGEALLQEVSLAIGRGEKIGIVGGNGAGKTTLANLLMGFYQPTSGTIRIAGEDIGRLGVERLREHFAVVGQDSYLFQDSVEGNINLRRDIGANEIREACRRSGAEELIGMLPQGYGHRIGTNGASLSGGERQKLILARALLKPAEIVILDEATSNCDAESETAFYDVIDSYLTGKTVILITHKYSNLMRLDRVFELKAGRLRQIGADEMEKLVQ